MRTCGGAAGAGGGGGGTLTGLGAAGGGGNGAGAAAGAGTRRAGGTTTVGPLPGTTMVLGPGLAGGGGCWAGWTAGTPLVSGTMYTDGAGADPDFPKTTAPTKAPPPIAANNAAATPALRSDDELPDGTGSGGATRFGRSIGLYPSYQPDRASGEAYGRPYCRSDSDHA